MIFLHKGSTEGGKTDASELGARRCEISRRMRFVSRHAFWRHHYRNCRRWFLSNSNWKKMQLKLTPGSKLVQKWVNKFRNLETVDESKSPGEVDHQTTGHHRAGCRLRPAEPEKVHDLASGTGASEERLSKDHEGRLHRFYLHINKYFFSFMILRSHSTDARYARCQMDLSGLCWTEAATCSIVVVWWSDLPWWLTFIHCHQITKLVDPFLYQLTPRGKFQLQIFPIGVRQESPPTVSCSYVAKMHVSTQNVFSLIFHIVLHQVHWHLFCHLM